jgi:ubiquinone/menaquinone biosynthesis C-methylase UbiE
MMTTQAPSKKTRKDVGIEGSVARWYARITENREDYHASAQKLTESVPAGGSVLEVAPGPGYLSIELAKLGYRVTGLDISHTFVELARQKAREAGVQVDFRQGNASAMPFEDEQFDFIICRAAFKNFAGPVEALNEMYRTLKPGGCAVVVDMRREASRKDIKDEVHGMGLSAVNSLIVKLVFRFMLQKNAYAKSVIEQFVAQTRFKYHELKRSGIIGFELWLRR